MQFPIDIDPAAALGELVELNQKIVNGMDTLSRTRQEDITPGVTPKEEVWRRDNVVLYRYSSPANKSSDVSVLIVYALVNRPYMVDLQEDRSLVQELLNLGVDVYLIDWGYPGPSDRWLTLDDYINGYIDDCVDFLRSSTDRESVNLLGICQGGTFSLCYSALHPEKVRNLITMVTPVDFHSWDGLLNVWAQHVDPDLMVEAMGNIPGEFLNFGFLMLKPFQLGLRKYVDLIDRLDDEKHLMNFLRMENWIYDSPDQAGEAYRQFAKDFYIGNKLIKGEVVIGGRPVDLAQVGMPLLNLYADHDHLVPPGSSIALKDYAGTSDYTAQAFPVGHIGMYVSGKVQRELPPTIAAWLEKRA